MEQIITDVMKEVENGSFKLKDIDYGMIWASFLNMKPEELELAEEIMDEIHDRYGYGYDY